MFLSAGQLVSCAAGKFSEHLDEDRLLVLILAQPRFIPGLTSENWGAANP